MKKIHYIVVKSAGLYFYLQYRFLFIFRRTEQQMKAVDYYSPIKFSNEENADEHVVSNRKYNKQIIVKHPSLQIIQP